MRANEFLIEYNRAATVSSMGDRLIAAYQKEPADQTGLTGRIPDDQRDAVINSILGRIEGVDPTKNKEYTRAMANWYADGKINMEDLSSTLHDYLVKFHELKMRKIVQPPYNDILRYKNAQDFMDALDKFEVPDKTKPDERGQAKSMYEDADLRIIVPMDKAAACYYGRGTRWCTAAEKSNAFDTYNKKEPMYIIIPKQPTHVGEKWQFHFNSSQYMNEKDQPVNLTDLIQRYPQMTQIFAKQGKQYRIASLCLRPEKMASFIPVAQEKFHNEFSRKISYELPALAKSIMREIFTSKKLRTIMTELGEGPHQLTQSFKDDLKELLPNLIRDLDEKLLDVISGKRLNFEEASLETMENMIDQSSLMDDLRELTEHYIEFTAGEDKFSPEDLIYEAAMEIQYGVANPVDDIADEVWRQIFDEAVA